MKRTSLKGREENELQNKGGEREKEDKKFKCGGNQELGRCSHHCP